MGNFILRSLATENGFARKSNAPLHSNPLATPTERWFPTGSDSALYRLRKLHPPPYSSHLAPPR
jgi:hypothetical protein